MKKVFITLLIILFTTAAFSQQVPRERVILEIATGTWCGYCPGAAMGADDLVAAGCDVAVIEYHNGDAFANTASNYRNSYYNVPGYPTAHFDGVLEYVGGSATQSMYNNYLPLYNQRIAIPCDYTASIFGQNNGLTYDVTVVIDLHSGTPPANLTAHLVLTESEIQYNWQNQTELNYVCRAMYPNHFGTAVDFAGGNQVIITYNFTIDANWNTQHVELVSFLQDESSKEILQGTMVPIENIIPFQATAAFSCSNTEPCETTSVDFYDESMGQLVSWNWTFEGGNPATSTEENPTVTYNTPGIYDVQLIVADANISDTLLLENYITVMTTPVAPNTPSGPGDLCSGTTGYVYTTNSVPNTTDYTWTISPAAAGTIMGNSTTATLNVAAAYTGSIDITVRGNNQCGNGTWSQAFTATSHYVPAPFWISDGSAYCEGSEGIEVTLDGSETDIDYELYLDGDPTGNIVPGTGAAISFGYQTEEGIYTIKGTNDYCLKDMYGTAYIYPVTEPGQAATPYGDEAVCVGETTDYSTNGAVDAESYIWTLDPPEAGIISGTTVDASVTWSDTYTGAASITVQGINDCGEGLVSEPYPVSIEALPEPLISGDEYVYQNTTHAYSSPEHAGAGYEWSVTGGTIASGQGTHEISVTWGGPGTGYVNLTETSAAGCEGIATQLTVNIDPVGIEEPFMKGLTLYPNPAGSSLSIEFFAERDAGISIQVLNRLGQVVLSRMEEMTAGNNKVVLNTTGLPDGFYTIRFVTPGGSMIQEKLIIMK